MNDLKRIIASITSVLVPVIMLTFLVVLVVKMVSLFGVNLRFVKVPGALELCYLAGVYYLVRKAG